MRMHKNVNEQNLERESVEDEKIKNKITKVIIRLELVKLPSSGRLNRVHKLKSF